MRVWCVCACECSVCVSMPVCSATLFKIHVQLSGCMHKSCIIICAVHNYFVIMILLFTWPVRMDS